ncbi:hypothetical protein JTE90_010945 [Oedothorax gibbosus]|uniref:Peroxidase n=1 Tax=Oedothorax gibbosus TaxID=931172 RepID=A0AAV6UAJ0_9ARAC|nr:hypothetical protein JTE90_010945 [Oedothorax gibbosus]
MVARFVRAYCLCIVIIIVIFLEVALGLNNTLNSRQSLGNGLINVYRQNVFDPTFMDPGNFNAENSHSGTDTCIIADSIDCNPSSVYRTYDGTCNNLAQPTWGKAEGCHTRILEPHYEGAYDLRRSVKGGPLPLPRKITLTEFKNRYRPTHHASLFFTIFGQVVSHEMTNVGLQLAPGDKDCCNDEELAKNTSLCIPFISPPDDPFYSKFKVTCFDLRRSVPCPRCISTAKKQSLNFVTATLDGSLFYGNTEERALELRSLDGTGRMNVTKTEFGELLPTPRESDPPPQFCPEVDKLQCFEAGDTRVNQHSPLMSVSTLFVREHNNLADRLGELNPSWDGETRYQEARKIVAAELQNIVYSEYLPALLSPAHISHYNLSVQTDNKSTQYDSSVALGIWNEFSTAIFRLHSMIATQVGFDHHRFKDYFANALLLREGKMDNIIKGTFKVPSQRNDHYFIKDVTNHLYQRSFTPLPYGEDLVSLDVLRGRDNGIPPYVDMLRHLTGGRMDVTEFDDLAPLMPSTNIRSLKNLYKDVLDVDLFAGALMENIIPGSQLGPTSAAIVSMQFNNIKFGDRFYFEHEGEAGSFSPDQRESVKKVTLARVLCDNLRIKNIQKNPLYLESETNPVMKCEDIPPSLDLSSWKILSN